MADVSGRIDAGQADTVGNSGVRGELIIEGGEIGFVPGYSLSFVESTPEEGYADEDKDSRSAGFRT
jgi:hypothetical protein